MLDQIRPAIVLTLAFTLLTGIAYPLAMTGIGQAVLPAQANGSRIVQDDTVIGSSLIGQNFARPEYFWPRPSATGTEPYNGAASSGSNFGATDARLVARVAASTSGYDAMAPVPADAVTTSASGLDPHITPANARNQIARVAEARGQDVARIEAVLDEITEAPLLGIFGEPRVNVLALNLALDRMAPPAR
jgi:potassium-transporting ATPase KdpC subunit